MCSSGHSSRKRQQIGKRRPELIERAQSSLSACSTFYSTASAYVYSTASAYVFQELQEGGHCITLVSSLHWRISRPDTCGFILTMVYVKGAQDSRFTALPDSTRVGQTFARLQGNWTDNMDRGYWTRQGVAHAEFPAQKIGPLIVPSSTVIHLVKKVN